VRADTVEPFDFIGMALVGLGVGGLAFGLTVTGINFVPRSVIFLLVAGGAAATFAYIIRSRRIAAPVLDLSLFKLPSFRAGVGGGFIFRVGAGALPFLLPLLLQIGFGRTPFQSGLITLSTAAGAMMMKSAVPRILRQFGFRNALTWNAIIASLMLMACAAFTATTPVAAMVAVLLLGGFFRSLQFTSVNTIAYAEIEPQRMSRATSLVAVAQQLSQSVGVAVGALVVETVLRMRGHDVLDAADFPPAFLVVGLIAASSTFLFATMPPDAGEDMAQRKKAKQPEPAEAA
jgi:MFS family permease